MASGRGTHVGLDAAWPRRRLDPAGQPSATVRGRLCPPAPSLSGRPGLTGQLGDSLAVESLRFPAPACGPPFITKLPER